MNCSSRIVAGGMLLGLVMPLTSAFAQTGPAKLSIAVLDMSAKVGIDKGRAEVFAELVQEFLRNELKLKVIGRSDIEAMLGLEKMKDMIACQENSFCMAEIGGALGVDELLVGSLAKMGSYLVVSLKRVSPQKAKVIAQVARKLKRATDDDLIEAVGPMMRELYPAEELQKQQAAVDAAKQAEDGKKAEEARKLEEAKKAEELKKADEARKIDEAKRAEEMRLAVQRASNAEQQARLATEAARRAEQEARTAKDEAARQAVMAQAAAAKPKVEETKPARPLESRWFANYSAGISTLMSHPWKKPDGQKVGNTHPNPEQQLRFGHMWTTGLFAFGAIAESQLSSLDFSYTTQGLGSFDEQIHFLSVGAGAGWSSTGSTRFSVSFTVQRATLWDDIRNYTESTDAQHLGPGDIWARKGPFLRLGPEIAVRFLVSRYLDLGIAAGWPLYYGQGIKLINYSSALTVGLPGAVEATDPPDRLFNIKSPAFWTAAAILVAGASSTAYFMAKRPAPLGP
jgi:hypothetical protein